MLNNPVFVWECRNKQYLFRQTEQEFTSESKEKGQNETPEDCFSCSLYWKVGRFLKEINKRECETGGGWKGGGGEGELYHI